MRDTIFWKKIVEMEGGEPSSVKKIFRASTGLVQDLDFYPAVIKDKTSWNQAELSFVLKVSRQLKQHPDCIHAQIIPPRENEVDTALGVKMIYVSGGKSIFASYFLILFSTIDQSRPAAAKKVPASNKASPY